MLYFGRINLNYASEFQTDPECERTEKEVGLVKINCRNGTIKHLKGENIEKLVYENVTLPLLNEDLIIYPNLTEIQLDNNFLGNVSQDLLKGMY